MGEHRMKVLEMLSEGKITAEEAERLLDRLEGAGAAAAPPRPEKPADSGAAPKYLRVVVDSKDGDKVNVRVPLELIRTGVKMGALLPQHARSHLEEKGIDLSSISEMDTEELVRALTELTVDVDSKDGDAVRIFCE